MMPMPPTMSEMAAVAPSSKLKMFCVSLRVRMNSAMLRTWKVSGAPRRTWRRWRSSVSISDCASLISSAEATSTMMRFRLSGTVFSAPNRRRRAVDTGTSAVSSWSMPKPDWPFGVSSADHGEGHVHHPHLLADDRRVGEQLPRGGGAEDGHLGGRSELCLGEVAALG